MTGRQSPSRRQVLAGTGAIMGGTLFGSPTATATATHNADTIYREAVAGSPNRDNLLFSYSEAKRYIHSLFDGTYEITPDGDLVPLWTTVDTDDNEVFVFELRDGLEWGGEFGSVTASDFVRTINDVFRSDEYHSGYAIVDNWNRYDHIDGIEVWDDRRFSVALTDPDPLFLRRPLLRRAVCLPQAVLDQYDRNTLEDASLTEPLGSGTLGPYRFEGWTGEKLYLERNPGYYLQHTTDVPPAWHDAPWFEAAELWEVPSDSIRRELVAQGEVTSSKFDPDEVGNVDDGLETITDRLPYVTSMYFNMRANGWEPFRRSDVRRAFATAIDKRSVLESVYDGSGSVTHTMQPTWSEWYAVSETFGDGATHDPDLARERLVQGLSGTPYEFDGDRLHDQNGTQVTLTFVTTPTGDGSQVAELVATMLQDVFGVQIDIQSVDFARMIESYLRNGEPGGSASLNGGDRDKAVSEQDWDMIAGVTLNSFVDVPDTTRRYLTAGGETNFYGYEPAADLERLYDEAEGASSLVAARHRYHEIFEAVSEEQPFVPLFTANGAFAFSSDLEGPADSYRPTWNASTWHPPETGPSGETGIDESDDDDETAGESAPAADTDEDETDASTDEDGDESASTGGDAESGDEETTDTSTGTDSDGADETDQQDGDGTRGLTVGGNGDDETPGFGFGLSLTALGIGVAGAAHRLRERESTTDHED
ncbi:ABC transporter substrate-binding protein [Halobacteria archaeon AArc-curdl1]|uniref:ABC transporter substrate-binding protein n=1 Tax=Natronosalvus hydrolyticus TaxID=2979988 RepID=A0AAP2Z5F6_9EURY|nr:ABC transporter substrate-binding protein [Halobacteria archaeon AArc-curdl1]